jgi:DNA-binding GntR family transcriptional regulator
VKPADFLKERASGRPISDVLAEIFRTRILDGEYLPGMRLVETEMVALYGVSRGTVREAFRKLIAEGLLRAEKHKSPVVRGVGREQFRQMFEVRSVLEGLAARLAAAKMDDEGKRTWVADTISRWSSNSFRTADEFVKANTELHGGLQRLIDNKVLQDQIDRVAIPGFKAVFSPTITAADIELSATQHVDILEAILAGDPERAETCMRFHVMDTAARVIANYSEELFDARLRELTRLKADAESSGG